MRGDQLVWGSFVRLFSLAFALAFASLRRQLIGLVGRRGLYPAAALLAQARRDMPAVLPRGVLLRYTALAKAPNEQILVVPRA